MNYILFDDIIARTNLLPLTFTRPVAEVRIGILTIREKWENLLGVPVSFKTEDYLSKKYALKIVSNKDNVWINGSICPNKNLIKEIKALKPKYQLISDDILIAYNTGKENIHLKIVSTTFTKIDSNASLFRIEKLSEIFSKNEKAIKEYFELITQGR